MPVGSMAGAGGRWAKTFDRARLARLADGLAGAVAVSIPWSTSATSLFLGLWLLALLPTLRPSDVRRVLAEPGGGLPVLLWGLAVVGGLWSAAPFIDQVNALRGFHKLLVIPLLLIHFRRSDKGTWVLGGFLVSCTVLLAVSWVLHFAEVYIGRSGVAGVPVKDYITQSMEFLICVFALGHLALDAWHAQRPRLALGLAVLALLFFADVAFVAAGRTTMVAFPVLLLLFALQRFGWKRALGVMLAGAVLAALLWVSSSYLRGRALGVAEEVQRYQVSHVGTSAGYRLEFWKKSLGFIAEAPVLGHGTGSIFSLFRGVASEGSDIGAAVTGNPHNQIIEIGIQFGLLGVAVLFAMWIAQFALFTPPTWISWTGQAMVAQTVVGSLFLSYMLDFSTGWIYVFGIGVLGGTVRPHGIEHHEEPEQQPSAADPVAGMARKPDRAGALQNCPR